MWGFRAFLDFYNRPPLRGRGDLDGVIMRHILTKSALVLAISAVALGTSACREEEQGRPLNYEKGIYLGKSDTSLSSEQLRDLTSRSRLQSDY